MGRGNSTSTTNTFEGGMVTDLHVGASPSNTVSYALNMELITTGENQYIFQNIKGNKHIVDFPKYKPDPEGSLEYQFIPLGLKVNNNIAYIILGAFKDDGTFVSGGIGTFPSPDWSILNSTDFGAPKTTVLRETFSFLHNFKLTKDGQPNKPFITDKFNLEKNRYIDMDIQGDFDGSVNILFTDNKNSPAIINSRFKRVEASQFVSLADRAGNKDSNIYSDADWDRIALIQNTNYPVKVTTDSGEENFKVLEGGYLRGGGYRYYLKYATQEGNTTELLYESPLIPISNGGLGLSKAQVSDKMIQFTLSELDSSYAGVRVYFAHFDGEDAATMEIFKIDYVFSYGNTDSLVITHTGLEAVTLVDPSEISIGFTPIDTIKTAAIVNDRLALAGASSTISEQDVAILSAAALDMLLWEKTKPISKSYADPEMAAKYLGYWKGEVYEFAVVFSLLNKGLSPAFPVKGMDNLLNVQSTFLESTYRNTIIDPDLGFSSAATHLVNDKGLFRTSFSGDIYQPMPGDKGIRYVTYIEVDTSKTATNTALASIATGFFIVRRKRVKNVLMQGMAVPTLRVPAKYPSLAENVTKEQASISASKRYLVGHYRQEGLPTIGLNAPYFAVKVNGEPSFNDDFDTVFVPQPTAVLNVLTSEKSWYINGSIGQAVNSENYGETVDKDGIPTRKLHLGFFSCELDMNFPAVKSSLNGINPQIEIQKVKNGTSPIGYTHTFLNATGIPAFKSTSNLVVRNAEKISIIGMKDWITLPAVNIKATLMESGRASFSKGGFTAKTDRALGVLAQNIYGIEEQDASGDIKISYMMPFRPSSPRSASYGTEDENVMISNSKVLGIIGSGSAWYSVYSIIAQSYSRYLGIEVSLLDLPAGIVIPPVIFNYNRTMKSQTIGLPNGADIMMDDTGDVSNRKFLSIGHLANVFRSATGRWTETDIVNIYKYDSNKVYYAVTNRTSLNKTSVDVFRGDGFISRIFKKVTYKNGIPTAKSANSADASDYGIGLLKDYGGGIKPEELNENELNDPGRGLYDVGQVIEITSFSNINADIRSTQLMSPEESLIYSGDRDFYPNKQDVFGDSRPDSTGYNHGYTGEDNPVSYSRIESNSPSFNTEFPNRILLSERNKTQSFFNSFRDLKGFNYRDYGVELGPIIKLVAIKNVLLSIHPTGVLAIGVDDRTLVAEGSDVFVNTAQSLSPNSKSVSSLYGAIHAEAVVKTDTTVAGVDYNASAVWLFEGDNLSVISEFAVKTILDEFKLKIEKGGFAEGDSGASYMSRVYTTFNHAKHVLYISYVAQDSITKEQYHVGTISYSTVLQKWMSRISEGNKFSISIGSATYTTGFSSDKDLWKEDALVDPATDKFVRSRLRGVDYTYEFEIVLNKDPALEKVLDNLRLITNKSVPYEIVYTTSGDENDAALDIWGDRPEKKELNQKIITRNNSSRKQARLGILDENAYYKNSGLYIEVGRISHTLRRDTGYKRVRDKSIKVKFIYRGNDETFLQAIISMLSISYN